MVEWYAVAMTDQMELPFTSWDEGSRLRTQSGKTLERWGSVRDAGRVLWGYDKKVIYTLIEAGEVVAHKRPGRNCKWRVDMLSVWDYKQRVEKGEAVKV